jgi:D-alanine-D-alanine ligase
MLIGLCFDLRSWYLDKGFSSEETAEFDKEETIGGIENALAGLGFQTERIGNIFQLVEALASGKRWELVFNISEGLYGPSRESVVPALLDQYRIPYVFSNAEVLGISLNKHLAKQIVAAYGVPVAPGIVVSQKDELKNIGLEFPLFVKPLFEGTGKGINDKSRVENPSSLVLAVEHVLNNSRQPALVEEFLPGREFTVGIIGGGNSAKIVGAMEIFSHLDSVYSMNVKENYEQLAHYTSADAEMMKKCSRVTLKAWRALGAVDGGRIDLRFDRHDRLCFIEANPLAGLNPVHSDLPMLARMNNISYGHLIGMIMEAAITRLKITR